MYIECIGWKNYLVEIFQFGESWWGQNFGSRVESGFLGQQWGRPLMVLERFILQRIRQCWHWWQCNALITIRSSVFKVIPVIVQRRSSFTLLGVAVLLNARNDVRMSSYLDHIFQYEIPINLIFENYNFGHSLVLDFTMCDFVDFRKKKLKFEFDSGRHEKPYIW